MAASPPRGDPGGACGAAGPQTETRRAPISGGDRWRILPLRRVLFGGVGVHGGAATLTGEDGGAPGDGLPGSSTTQRSRRMASSRSPPDATRRRPLVGRAQSAAARWTPHRQAPDLPGPLSGLRTGDSLGGASLHLPILQSRLETQKGRQTHHHSHSRQDADVMGQGLLLKQRHDGARVLPTTSLQMSDRQALLLPGGRGR